MKTLAEEVFSLTNMDWNSTQMEPEAPHSDPGGAQHGRGLEVKCGRACQFRLWPVHLTTARRSQCTTTSARAEIPV